MNPEEMRERAAEIADKWTTDLQRRFGNGGPAAEIRTIPIESMQEDEPESTRIVTHAPDCHTWGPRHYECLMRKYKALESALDMAVDRLAPFALMADQLDEWRKRGGDFDGSFDANDLCLARAALAEIRKITGEM